MFCKFDVCLFQLVLVSQPHAPMIFTVMKILYVMYFGFVSISHVYQKSNIVLVLKQAFGISIAIDKINMVIFSSFFIIFYIFAFPLNFALPGIHHITSLKETFYVLHNTRNHKAKP